MSEKLQVTPRVALLQRLNQDPGSVLAALFPRIYFSRAFLAWVTDSKKYYHCASLVGWLSGRRSSKTILHFESSNGDTPLTMFALPYPRMHATTVADNITVRPPAIFYRGRSPVYLGLLPEIIEPPRKINDDEPILVLATIG